jgi:hypothetical protein
MNKTPVNNQVIARNVFRSVENARMLAIVVATDVNVKLSSRAGNQACQISVCIATLVERLRVRPHRIELNQKQVSRDVATTDDSRDKRRSITISNGIGLPFATSGVSGNAHKLWMRKLYRTERKGITLSGVEPS